MEVGAWAVGIHEIVCRSGVEGAEFDVAVDLVGDTDAGGVLLGDGVVCCWREGDTTLWTTGGGTTWRGRTWMGWCTRGRKL